MLLSRQYTRRSSASTCHCLNATTSAGVDILLRRSLAKHASPRVYPSPRLHDVHSHLAQHQPTTRSLQLLKPSGNVWARKCAPRPLRGCHDVTSRYHAARLHHPYIAQGRSGAATARYPTVHRRLLAGWAIDDVTRAFVAAHAADDASSLAPDADSARLRPSRRCQFRSFDGTPLRLNWGKAGRPSRPVRATSHDVIQFEDANGIRRRARTLEDPWPMRYAAASWPAGWMGDAAAVPYR